VDGRYKDGWSSEGNHEYTPLFSLTEILVTVQTSILFNTLISLPGYIRPWHRCLGSSCIFSRSCQTKASNPSAISRRWERDLQIRMSIFSIYAVIDICYCRAKLVSPPGLAVSPNGQKNGRTDPPLHPILQETEKTTESRSKWFVPLFELSMQSNHISG
jgi:hypothetical protein